MKILLLLSLLSLNAFGHGDHGSPGAIPPAPHGGTLGEAEHIHAKSHDHDHGEATKREVFFEGKIIKNTLHVYALELEPKKMKSFINLKLSDFKDAKFKLIDARKKKTIKVDFNASKSSWEASIKGHRARRYMVEIDAKLHGARYKTKLQVERK